jgi:hypothetical protein
LGMSLGDRFAIGGSRRRSAVSGRRSEMSLVGRFAIVGKGEGIVADVDVRRVDGNAQAAGFGHVDSRVVKTAPIG